MENVCIYTPLSNADIPIDIYCLSHDIRFVGLLIFVYLDVRVEGCEEPN